MAHIIEACGKQYTVGIGDTQEELCEIIEENMGTEFSKEVQQYIDYINQTNSPSSKEKLSKALDLIIETCQSAWGIDSVLDCADDGNVSVHAKNLIKALDLLWEVYDGYAE